MSKPALTQRLVEDAVCPAGKKDVLIFDGDLPGFGLRVTASGSKIFLAQYSGAAGKRRIKIGPFGALTVKEARTRARAILGAVAEGRDPVGEKRQAAASAVAAEAEVRAKEKADAFTVRKLLEEWERARADKRRPSYLRSVTASITLHLQDWLDRPAAAITAEEARDRIEEVAVSAPIAANRCLAYARAAFGWAYGRSKLPSNPFAGIERPGHEKARDRVLSADELGAIWRASTALGTPYGAFVRVLLLTLQRREEVAGMRWSELDLQAGMWTLPAERAKNGKAHLVHLTEPVRELLTALPRIKDVPFVFGSGNGRPITAFSYAKRTIDAALAAEAAEAGSASPAEGWRFHDFRRAGVTKLADMGFPPHVADKLLNHVTGAIQGVAAVYQRAQFLPERKAALEAWARFVLAAAEGRAVEANVVALSRELRA